MSESDKIAAAILTQTVLSSQAAQTTFQQDVSAIKDKPNEEAAADAIEKYYSQMLVLVKAVKG